MANIRQSYRMILRRELARRRKLNRRYSLRAFARFLKISPARLSAIFSGNEGLSPERARTIAGFLGFDPRQSTYFFDLVSSEHSRSPERRREAAKRILQTKKAEFWPEAAPFLRLQHCVELNLWGLADPERLAEFFKSEGHEATPFRNPEHRGATRVGLMVRKNLDGPSPTFEFSVNILIADIHSNLDFSVFIYHHLTDSVSVVESRKEFFGVAPALAGRMALDVESKNYTAHVENEIGGPFIQLEASGLGTVRREFDERFSLVRHVKKAGHPFQKCRVVGESRNRVKKFDPLKDDFRIRPRSPVDALLKRILFRPHSWRFYRSRYDYFPLEELE